jgi:hypothetical protein
VVVWQHTSTAMGPPHPPGLWPARGGGGGWHSRWFVVWVMGTWGLPMPGQTSSTIRGRG